MKPELLHFFSSMDAFFGEDRGPEPLLRAHPDWSVNPARVALYGDFVRGHVEDTLDKLYPLTRAALGARWSEVRSGFVKTRPAKHFELNRIGEAFPSFLADSAEPLGLPAFAPALARFEWTDFAVYASEVEERKPEQGMIANPTLLALEHAWQICPYVRRGGQGEPPSPGNELALLWRHPERRITMYQAAGDDALLVLKIAMERLTLEQVCAGTSLERARLDAMIAEHLESGLLLGSP